MDRNTDILSKIARFQGQFNDMAATLSDKDRKELSVMLGDVDFSDAGSVRGVAASLTKADTADGAIEKIKINYLNRIVQDVLKKANEEQKSFVSKHFGDVNNAYGFEMVSKTLLSKVNGNLGTIIKAFGQEVETRNDPEPE